MSQTIFEKSVVGRRGVALGPVPAGPADACVPQNLKRKQAARLPEVSEPEVIRHYVGLSTKNFHVDKGFYPLGSCTMKYNPKINDEVAGLAGFAHIHPEQPEHSVQGAMALYHELECLLAEVAGFAGVSLQPAAGAHGELAGMLIIRAFHRKNGNNAKSKILIPDSAHGTNPASAAMVGYETIQIQSGPDGRVDMADLASKVDDHTAGIMITNPNTLGLYEAQIRQIAEEIHNAGGLVYMDGANLNALVGNVRPGELGVDVMHFNLHKSFSAPHGGGGPGSGPIGVSKPLVPFLPVPRLKKENDTYSWEWELPDSIGRVHGYYGNFLVMVKAYAYLLMVGKEGLATISEDAILNANYLLKLLSPKWGVAYPGPVAHEFVLSAKPLKQYQVRALDVAKRLIDLGYHPPTIYFPLIVPEALMIEPTETESKETLETFAAAMNRIAEEARTMPEILRNSPRHAPVQRLDEVKAAKELNVKAL